MQFHQLTEKYPLLDGEEYERFKAAIRAADGCRLSILTYKGQIIDGRNRYRACVDLGLDPPIKEWEGPEEDLEKFIDWLNRDRRHLTAEHRRKMVQWQLKRDSTQSDKEIAEIVQCSRNTVAEIRDEMKAEGQAPPTKTSDGIKQEAIEFIKANPEANNAVVGEKFGVSRHTIAAIRKEIPIEELERPARSRKQPGQMEGNKPPRDREPGEDEEDEEDESNTSSHQSGASESSGKAGGAKKPGPRETLKRWLAEGKINQRIADRCKSLKGQKLKQFMSLVEDGLSVADAIKTVETAIEPEAEKFTEKDGVGLVLPEEMRPVFALRKKFEEVRGLLRKAQAVVHEICSLPGGQHLLRNMGIERTDSDGVRFYKSEEIHHSISQLEWNEPFCSVCPSCAEHNPGRIDKKCLSCLGSSWVTKRCWDSSPAEHQQKVIANGKPTPPAGGKWGQSVVADLEREINSANSERGLQKRLEEMELIKERLGTEYHRLLAKAREKLANIGEPKPELATTTEG